MRKLKCKCVICGKEFISHTGKPTKTCSLECKKKDFKPNF